jgi:hypothetical protein
VLTASFGRNRSRACYIHAVLQFLTGIARTVGPVRVLARSGPLHFTALSERGNAKKLATPRSISHTWILQSLRRGFYIQRRHGMPKGLVLAKAWHGRQWRKARSANHDSLSGFFLRPLGSCKCQGVLAFMGHSLKGAISLEWEDKA